MKKIEFGFNDDNHLGGPSTRPDYYNGEFLGLFNYDKGDYLVTRIVDSMDGKDGNIDVREITQDYYADGSYITYGNKLKTTTCQKFEELFNMRKIKEALTAGKSPLAILAEEGQPVRVSYLHDVTSAHETLPAQLTSYKPEVFGRLKASKKEFSGMSMYDLASEVRKLRSELASQEAKMSDVVTRR